MSDPDNNLLPDFDDDGCDDEEGCEIDWDAMPPFFDEEEDIDEVEAAFLDDFHMAQERLHLSPPQPMKSGPSVEQKRIHMEMQWQLTESADECVVEKPETCGSEKCPDCHGRGWSDCRFCHGTTVLRMDHVAATTGTSHHAETGVVPPSSTDPTTMGDALISANTATPTTAIQKFILPSSFASCKICQQGVEVCRTCQGSGWIAAWTQIPSQSKTSDGPLLP
jgi:DnaJ-class molecular chaperone